MPENVKFETDDMGFPKGVTRASSDVMREQQDVPGMARWLVKHGIISSGSTAKVALVAIVLVNFLVAGLVLYFFVLR
jgi:Flp pilus assembly protein TadB